jgi:hypothetical protein
VADASRARRNVRARVGRLARHLRASSEQRARRLRRFFSLLPSFPPPKNSVSARPVHCVMDALLRECSRAKWSQGQPSSCCLIAAITAGGSGQPPPRIRLSTLPVREATIFPSTRTSNWPSEPRSIWTLTSKASSMRAARLAALWRKPQPEQCWIWMRMAGRMNDEPLRVAFVRPVALVDLRRGKK